MLEIFAAAIGALTVLAVPLVAWISRRSTREGRLLLRMERLGRVLVLMPQSPERELFEVQVRGAIGDLNAWLDVENRRRRILITWISWVSYIAGASVALALLLNSGEPSNAWLGLAYGLSTGFVVSIADVAIIWALEMRAERRSVAEAKERELAAAETRMEAIRLGSTP
jgi:hypothetical protein